MRISESSGRERTAMIGGTRPSNLKQELGELIRFSARLGRDPLLVQASSGNTSFKVDGTLWIKASGKWLAHADDEEFLVPVNISECLRCLHESLPFPEYHDGPNQHYLRPSIETFMHAVLPQRVVVHVHSINAIALAVRADAPARFAEKLLGLRWQWIPYVPSGQPLAREIRKASLLRPDTDIYVLGNHGLVICGHDCEHAESLLSEVERRLAASPLPAPGPNRRLLDHLAAVSGKRIPDNDEVHGIATDTTSFRIASGGILYPCQAIFLGPDLWTFAGASPPIELNTRIREAPRSWPLLVIEGAGVLISDQITAAEYEVLCGFSEVLRRLTPGAPIRYLTDHDVDGVLGVTGDQYRMAAQYNVRQRL